MGERTKYSHGTFCWVDLATTDAAKAKNFYSGVFGWNYKDNETPGGPYCMASHDGKDVNALYAMPDEMQKHNVPPHWLNYVSCENVDSVVKKSESIGGKVTMPAMDVMDAGRMAVIQDTSGASLGLWQPENHIGAGWVNHPGGFCWNELISFDVEKSKTFYNNLFKWDFETDKTGYTTIRNQNSDNGGIFDAKKNKLDSHIPESWSVYFSVANIDETIEKVKLNGGQQIVETMEIDPGRFAVLKDDQGTYFQAIQLKRIDD